MTTFLIIIGIVGLAFYLLNALNNVDSSSIEDYFNKAQMEHDRGNYHEAIQILNEAIKKSPNHYQLWNNRGNAKFELGWFEESLVDFNKSIALNSDWNKNMKAYMNKEKAISALRWDMSLRNNLTNDLLNDQL